MLKHWLLIIFLFSFHAAVFPQAKSLTAAKSNGAIKIDADLSDPAWQSAAVAVGFVQFFPTYGLPANTNTEVKILYNDDAVYVSAYLYDDPSLIRQQVTSRDGEQRQDVDYFSVFFDTYNDQQNGFQFLVTPSNVQSDTKLNNASNFAYGDFGDKTWDAVWQSKTTLKKDGWIVEIRIPYISLRFSKKEVQTWGLQFLRFTRRNNENAYWSPVDPNTSGFINQFGKLNELRDIEPPLRLSFSPYLSGGIRFNPDGSRKDKEWLRNGGMDVKWGINESFTLDVTLIPDFGQVVSDNVINNLSPFEVRFEENRPFFTEGTELFNKSNLFYSRRIGAIPGGYFRVQNFLEDNPGYTLINNPSVTQLYNGIKLSGRTKKKLGIGVFNALTAPIEARLLNVTTKIDTVIQTEPMANYNIVVLDQALKGRSSVTFTNTNVIRKGTARDANVTALDLNLYNGNNKYNLKAQGRYSKIFLQNPYDGFYSSLRLAKVSGNIQYNLQQVVISDKYNPRDLGYLQTPNQVVSAGGISYNQFTPTRNFINYRYSLNANYSRLYKPGVSNTLQLTGGAFWVFKNFWDVSITLGYLPDQHDYFLLGAPFTHYARRPSYGFAEIEGSTDSRKRLFFAYEYVLATFFKADEKKYSVLDMDVRYRFSNRFNLEISGRNEGETDYIVSAGREANGEPVIGFVDFKDISTILSGTYNFTSRVNLNLRARHYWSQVLYKRFGHVDEKGRELFRDPNLPAPDVNGNVNVFNLDAFLTWDFRLGSKMVVGYKNWLGDNESINGVSKRYYLNNLTQTFDESHGNELTVRFIYFLDYNQLRRKK